jgi:hypothetical protein
MADSPPYTRKCQNWLVDFGKWMVPRSEAPMTYIFWTGLFTLAATLRRHVKVPKKYLGGWEASPNLYVLFIAPPGELRKTTTIDQSAELTDAVPGLTMSPDVISRESFLKTLIASPDMSMCINAGEFSEFIMRSQDAMYSFLTNAYDGKKRIVSSTISRGVEFAERPCVNLIGATTPVWVAENMPESVIGGGFASRVIFIYEEEVRTRQMYYDHLDQTELETIKQNLISDLIHIASIEGDFTIDPIAKDFMENWYRESAAEARHDNFKLRGYYQRRPAHVHKIAMILHLARSDTLTLELEDFQKAIGYLKVVEKKLPKTFEAIGKNVYAVDMFRIIEYVNSKGQVSKKELYDAFLSAARPSELYELVQGLVLMEHIEEVKIGELLYYRIPGHRQEERVAFMSPEYLEQSA